MVLTKYFYKRFFKYIFLINISLTLLFNLIEFFEKIVRLKHATFSIVLNFILLNIPSSFFETLPISTWLATCLLLRELVQQNEWETLLILNINYKKILTLFFCASTVLAIFSFIGKEYIVLSIANKSEKFKQEKLKQTSQQQIINKWFLLSGQNIFCHFDCLNLKNNNGKNLLLIYMNNNFKLNKIISGKNFTINKENNTVLIPEAIITKLKDNTYIKTTNKTLELTSLLSQISLENGIPSIGVLLKTYIYGLHSLPQQIQNDILYQISKRFLLHIQIIIYTLLVLSLFMFFFYSTKWRWVIIFLPYPLMIFQELIITTFIQKNLPAIIAFIPYLLIFILIFIIQKKLAKSL